MEICIEKRFRFWLDRIALMFFYTFQIQAQLSNVVDVISLDIL